MGNVAPAKSATRIDGATNVMRGDLAAENVVHLSHLSGLKVAELRTARWKVLSGAIGGTVVKWQSEAEKRRKVGSRQAPVPHTAEVLPLPHKSGLV